MDFLDGDQVFNSLLMSDFALGSQESWLSAEKAELRLAWTAGGGCPYVNKSRQLALAAGC